MTVSISAYTPDVPIPFSGRTYTVADKIRPDELPNLRSSLFISEIGDEHGKLNRRAFAILDDISKLGNNWDEEGSLPPTTHVQLLAKALTLYLNAVGQEVYNIAPGPRQEIMIDVRKGNKSIEFIFYPDKARFVKFSDLEKPQQGEFTTDLLSQLLSWVNGI